MKKKHWYRRVITVLLTTALLVGLLYQFGHKTYMERTYPVQFSQYVEAYSAEYGVPEDLIYAIIQVESGFEPNAISEVHAIGLMQMTEETYDWLSSKTGDTGTFKELYTPEYSIQYGTYFLSILMDRYEGDYTTVAAAYHAGMGSVNSWLTDAANSDNGVTLTNVPADDTAHYVTKVLHAVEIYQEKLS